MDGMGCGSVVARFDSWSLLNLITEAFYERAGGYVSHRRLREDFEMHDLRLPEAR